MVLVFSEVKGVLSIVKLFLTFWKVKSDQGGGSTVGGLKAAEQRSRKKSSKQAETEQHKQQQTTQAAVTGAQTAATSAKTAAETAAKRHKGGRPEGQVPEGSKKRTVGCQNFALFVPSPA